MKLDKYLRKRKIDKPQQPMTATQARFPISPEELVERLDAIEREVKALRADTRFATQLAYTVDEAAQITRIGINKLRERCGMPESEPQHIKVVHIGSMASFSAISSSRPNKIQPTPAPVQERFGPTSPPESGRRDAELSPTPRTTAYSPALRSSSPFLTKCYLYPDGSGQ